MLEIVLLTLLVGTFVQSVLGLIGSRKAKKVENAVVERWERSLERLHANGGDVLALPKPNTEELASARTTPAGIRPNRPVVTQASAGRERPTMLKVAAY